MKIAAITEDGTTISQHFGRAPLYCVITTEDGSIVDRETRPKAGHHTFAAGQHPETAPGERHGFDAGAQSRHSTMAGTIAFDGRDSIHDMQIWRANLVDITYDLGKQVWSPGLEVKSGLAGPGHIPECIL